MESSEHFLMQHNDEGVAAEQAARWDAASAWLLWTLAGALVAIVTSLATVIYSFATL